MANRRLPDASKSPDPPATAEAAHRTPRSRKLPTDVPALARLAPEARRALIAKTAYLRAERRGFAPGHEVEDWLLAEAEVDALLTVAPGGSPQ